MTRRLRSVPAATAVEDLPTCLLCDQPCHVVSETAEELVTWDLCAACDGVFQVTAARVAAAAPLVVTGPAAAALEHVAGQLHLEDQ